MNGALSSKKGLLVAGALALVAVLAGGWLLVVSPKRSDAKELAIQVTAAQTELAQKKADLARPSASIRVRPGDIYRLARALPEGTDTSGVLLDIDNLANKNRLEFGSIRPQAAILGLGTLQQPFNVTVEGRFTDVSRFLGDVRKLVKVKRGTLDVAGRVYSVDSVQLGESTNEFPRVTATVQISSFSYTGPPPATAETPLPTDADGTVAAGANP